MKKSTTFGKLAAYSLITVICGASQVAMAHTGVKDKPVEGVAGYNAFTIGHGCTDNSNEAAVASNVIAQSVVFPNSADPLDAVIYKLNAAGLQVGAPLPDLSNDIEGVLPGVGFSNMGAGLVAGGGTLFPNFIPAINPAKAIRGYHTWSGPTPIKGAELQESPVSMTGLSPFRYGAIKFKATSCAKSLKIRIAVANWCKRGTASKKAPDRVDVWIGHTTTKFADQKTMPRATPYDPAIEAPFWPTMTLTRTSALPANCTADNSYDLSIEPSSNDIDTYLPMPTGKFPLGVPGTPFYN
ncbi:MAG: hypothetical protein NTV43_03380 [Methylococcales bacterium]|nr:hypothetical protein [Methylococcales bacterium]